MSEEGTNSQISFFSWGSSIAVTSFMSNINAHGCLSIKHSFRFYS